MSAETQSVGHHGQAIPERPGVDTRRLAWGAGAALLLLAVGIGGLSVIYSYEVSVKVVPPPKSFPSPQVIPDEAAERQRIETQQRQRLTGYHWANSQHTLVQIPIERAMQLIAAKGAHGYDALETAPAALASPEAAPERALTPAAAPPRSTNSSGAAPSGGSP